MKYFSPLLFHVFNIYLQSNPEKVFEIRGPGNTVRNASSLKTRKCFTTAWGERGLFWYWAQVYILRVPW